MIFYSETQEINHCLLRSKCSGTWIKQTQILSTDASNHSQGHTFAGETINNVGMIILLISKSYTNTQMAAIHSDWESITP